MSKQTSSNHTDKPTSHLHQIRSASYRSLKIDIPTVQDIFEAEQARHEAATAIGETFIPYDAEPETPRTKKANTSHNHTRTVDDLELLPPHTTHSTDEADTGHNHTHTIYGFPTSSPTINSTSGHLEGRSHHGSLTNSLTILSFLQEELAELVFAELAKPEQERSIDTIIHLLKEGAYIHAANQDGQFLNNLLAEFANVYPQLHQLRHQNISGLTAALFAELSKDNPDSNSILAMLSNQDEGSKISTTAKTFLGENLLILAAKHADNLSFEVFQRLFNLPGIDLNSTDTDGNTIVYHLVHNMRIDVLTELLTHHNVNLNIENYEGFNVLHTVLLLCADPGIQIIPLATLNAAIDLIVNYRNVAGETVDVDQKISSSSDFYNIPTFNSATAKQALEFTLEKMLERQLLLQDQLTHVLHDIERFRVKHEEFREQIEEKVTQISILKASLQQEFSRLKQTDETSEELDSIFTTIGTITTQLVTAKAENERLNAEYSTSEIEMLSNLTKKSSLVEEIQDLSDRAELLNRVEEHFNRIISKEPDEELTVSDASPAAGDVRAELSVIRELDEEDDSPKSGQDKAVDGKAQDKTEEHTSAVTGASSSAEKSPSSQASDTVTETHALDLKQDNKQHSDNVGNSNTAQASKSVGSNSEHESSNDSFVNWLINKIVSSLQLPDSEQISQYVKILTELLTSKNPDMHLKTFDEAVKEFESDSDNDRFASLAGETKLKVSPVEEQVSLENEGQLSTEELEKVSQKILIKDHANYPSLDDYMPQNQGISSLFNLGSLAAIGFMVMESQSSNSFLDHSEKSGFTGLYNTVTEISVL